MSVSPLEFPVVSRRVPPLRALRLAMAAFALAVSVIASSPAAADTIGVKSAELFPEEDGYYLNAEFEFSLNRRSTGAAEGRTPLFRARFELTRPRWYWVEEVALVDDAIPSLVQRADATVPDCSGLLAQTFESLDEVEHFLSRVTAREVARRDQLGKGTRYEAAVRLRLDVNQLPKPFQVSALASREWTLQSEWHRWSFTP
jgi:hypothetical protein